MAGVVQVLSHAVRRGLEQYPTVTNYGFDDTRVSKHDPPATSEPIELSTSTILMLAGIALMTFLIIASVDYTVGSLMARLTMIESPSTTTIIESAPPAYTDEPDAPLEKKENIQEIEVVVINHKPITARIVTTIKHLHRTGGFTARWRGLFQGVVYHIAYGVLGHIAGRLFNTLFMITGLRFLIGPTIATFLLRGLGHIFAVVALCRVHALWTHAMIAMPTNTRWYKRFIARKEAKNLLLPSLVYAVAHQITLLVPACVAYLCIATLDIGSWGERLQNGDNSPIAIALSRIFAIIASAVIVTLFVYLPAATTLARVEACLLPADQDTIVPFDRRAIIGEVDLSAKGASKQLFRSAWKSINGDVRGRLVKLFVKLTAFQVAVFMVALHLAAGVLYFTSKDQIINGLNMVIAA